jgi:UDP-glucose 4-epimerase
MRTLVLGSPSPLWRHVLEQLLATGAEIRAALPLSAGPMAFAGSVEAVAWRPDSDAALAAAIRGVDVVCDLGSRMVGDALSDACAADDLPRLAAACAVAGVRRYVQVSSVAVYAPAPRPSMWPVGETRRLEPHGDAALEAYGRSRIAREAVLTANQRRHGVQATILRTSAVYGPHALWAHRLLRSVRRAPGAARRKPQTFMQWTHERDLATAIAAAAARPDAAGVFNVAGSELVSERRLAEAVQRIGRGADAGPPLDGLPLKYDLTKARDRLGWSPAVPLDEGLRELLAVLRWDEGPAASRRLGVL